MTIKLRWCGDGRLLQPMDLWLLHRSNGTATKIIFHKVNYLLAENQTEVGRLMLRCLVRKCSGVAELLCLRDVKHRTEELHFLASGLDFGRHDRLVAGNRTSFLFNDSAAKNKLA